MRLFQIIGRAELSRALYGSADAIGLNLVNKKTALGRRRRSQSVTVF